VRDQQIRTSTVGETIRDDVVRGLQLRSFAGRKSFYVYYRVHGKQRKPKIGDWPDLSLAQARAIAKDMLLQVAQGRDPQSERVDARTAPTVGDMCARYMDEHGAAKKSARDDRSLIKGHVLPHFGSARVIDLDYKMVAAFHRAIPRPIRANRAIALLSVMLTFAERWNWRPMGSNPCRHIKRNRENRRRRYMTADEAVKIDAELRSLIPTRPQSVAFIYLLIYTGARLGEIAKAT
jgi:integrase